MSALPLIHYLLCVCCAAARLELLCCAAARLIIYSKIRILLFYLHVTDCSVWYDVLHSPHKQLYYSYLPTLKGHKITASH